MAAIRVLVLGAGFGGLEVAASLAERLGERVEVTLIDQAADFVFGFAKLDVMFGRRSAAEVRHAYGSIARPGLRVVRARVTGIDAAARRVTTDAGVFEADRLVIALGADVDASATPGMVENGHEYYSNDGAFALADRLAAFEGGRVLIGVAGPVFKCPPAPSETAILVDDMLRRRGVREGSEVTLAMPLPAPVPPVPDASAGLLAAFDERGIRWLPGHVISRVDPGRAVFAAGDDEGFDLFLGVPLHVAPEVVRSSGLAADGWIGVDHESFRTEADGVFAIGDVAATGTPKAGVFAAGQGAVVASQIAAEVTGSDPDTYDGAGVCYVEFGDERAASVDVVFAPGQAPRGAFGAADPQTAAAKEDYRTSRIRRWFG